MRAKTSWSYSGKQDFLVGTGATRAERLLAYGSAVILTVLIVAADQLSNQPAAPGWRVAVLAIFAFDIAGGAVANMLNSCKRFYHAGLQPGEGLSARLAKNPRLFTLIHVHPLVFAWLLGLPMGPAFVWYLLLQAGVAIVLWTPLYLRRATATALAVAALLGSQSWLPLGTGADWFLPCLFLKMLLGHAVREEPYAAG